MKAVATALGCLSAALTACAAPVDVDGVQLDHGTAPAAIVLEPLAAEPARAPELAAPLALFADGDLEPARVLRLAPAPELRDAVLASAARYRARLGLVIEVVGEGGIPVQLADEVVYRGRQVDAVARYARRCAWDECQGPAMGVRIDVARALIEGKAWALAQTLDHEIGHIASAWGDGSPMHTAPGSMMSAAPCEGGVCHPWSDADASLLCGAGAPCEVVSLDAEPSVGLGL